MTSRRQCWPLVIVLSGALLATLVAADVQSSLRIVLTLWFLLVCTGMAFVPLLSIERPLTELGLGVIASIAVDSVVTTAILLAGDLSAATGLLALEALCLLGCAAQIGAMPALVLGKARVAPRLRLPNCTVDTAPVQTRPFAVGPRIAVGVVLAISAALAMTPDLDISSPRHDEYQGTQSRTQAIGQPLAVEGHLSQHANDQRHDLGRKADRTPHASGGVAGERARRTARARLQGDSGPGVGNWNGDGSRPTHDGTALEQQPLARPSDADRPPSPAASPSTSPRPAPASMPGDRDGDGVLDKEDNCPNRPATDNGCPVRPPADPAPRDPAPADRDGDGIPNNQDNCPNRPGTDNGCPVKPPADPAPADRDGDGIPNNQDNCPNRPGIDNGCPVRPPRDGIPLP
jgi:hypothetical protein